MSSGLERQQQIEVFGKAHTELLAALENFPQAMWGYHPTPEAWTIHKILIHLADSEANGYLRFRKLAAEPGSTVLGYDEGKWAEALNYEEQSVEDALALFKLLRLTSYKLVKALPEVAWFQTVQHSENGEMDLDALLKMYAEHVAIHIQQMQYIFEDWKNQQHG